MTYPSAASFEDDPIFEIVDISPDEARRLLTSNAGNRRLDPGTVERYAGAMRRGEWKLSHQGVAVDRDGVLLDGQHRLAAIVKAGVNVRMTVARHVDRAAFSVLDTGKRRGAGDTLRLAGAPDPLHLSAALRYLRLYQTIPDSSWSSGQARLTNDQILQLHEDHPRMGGCVRRARAVSTNTGIITSACATAIYLASCVCPDLDDEPWFRGIITGANLDIGDPRLAFRTFFANTRAAAGKRRVDAREHVAIYIKAWNAWASGQKVKLLAFRKGAVMPRVVEPKTLRMRGV